MSNSRIAFLYATLAYIGFIIYGSLVPFEIRHKTLTEAWQLFQHIPYLRLGIVSRADWIANIVLYVPYSFFACVWLMVDNQLSRANYLRIFLVLVGGVSLAVGVEFTQIWFAPRTVSLNDIIAEIIGTIIGIVLWETPGPRLLDLGKKIVTGGPAAVQAVTTFYVLGYVAFSLFPYDFIVSGKELAWKLGTGRAHLIWTACGGTFVCLAKLVAEMLAVMPLGMLVGMLFPEDRRRVRRLALYVGLGLGVFVEICQFFLASGVSQGISVLTRGAGVMLGVIVYQGMSWQRFERFAPLFRPMIMIGAIPYGLALIVLNGWFTGHWLGLQGALARLAQVHFLPFYYHYYSAEAVALVSVIHQVGMYLPVGLACWAWSWDRVDAGIPRRAWMAAGIAAAVAMIVWAGKLFVPAKHPDPTDVLIAAFAGGGGYLLAAWIKRWSLQPAHVEGAASSASSMVVSPTPSVTGRQRGMMPRRLAAGLIGIVVALALIRYPLHAALLGLALVIYALLLWRRPSLGVVVIPALLPVLDLSPWSGWFFFDAFDLFILVTVAIGLWCPPAPMAGRAMSRLAVVLVALMGVSFLISLIVGLFPLSPLDANAFFSYMSHYNALRVAKGFVWALVLLPLLRYEVEGRGALAGRFMTGMVLGLAGTIIAVLWERYLYPGLFNFHSDYRVAATFFSMHTGGPQIEAYLIFALPFAVAWGLVRGTVRSFVITLLLCAGGVYGVLVTFSRGGYLALVVIMAIVAGSLFLRQERLRSAIVWRRATLAIVALVAVVIAVPVLRGGYAESRFQQVGTGVENRLHHWRSVLAMMDDGPFTTLFGMGLGRFPETYLNRNTRDVLPGNFRLLETHGNAYLRLGAKDSVYFGQRVAVEDHHRYVLSLDMRSVKGPGTLDVALCEKHLLFSMNCVQTHVESKGKAPGWRHYDIPIASGMTGAPIGGLRRSVELAFRNSHNDTLVDIDNLHFTDDHGRDLLRNGGFSQGHDRWFYTTDDNWPWRVENVWLQLFFEQGLVGVVAFSLLVLYALMRVVKEMRRGRGHGALVLASISGFLTVGLFGSVLESPRLMLLFYWVLFMILTTTRSGGPWLVQQTKTDSAR